MTPSCAQAAALPPLTTAAGGRHCSTRSALWIFLPPSYSLDGRLNGPTPFVGLLASAPRCAATSLLLRSCTVVLTIKRWDAPRPVSLTRGFKGHTPFIRPVFETASAASCLCHATTCQVRLGLLSPRGVPELFAIDSLPCLRILSQYTVSNRARELPHEGRRCCAKMKALTPATSATRFCTRARRWRE